jgi:hypothetical protein
MEDNREMINKTLLRSIQSSYVLLLLALVVLMILPSMDRSALAFNPPVMGRTSVDDSYKTLVLQSPPTSWGFRINGSSGEIKYNEVYQSIPALSLELRGLEPKHQYVLTINGKRWHVSNKVLRTKFQSYGEEGYYDFGKVTTDKKGNLNKKLSLELPPGDYNLKIFVKDPSNQWLPVLFNDFLIFKIE